MTDCWLAYGGLEELGGSGWVPNCVSASLLGIMVGFTPKKNPYSFMFYSKRRRTEQIKMFYLVRHFFSSIFESFIFGMLIFMGKVFELKIDFLLKCIIP